MVYDGSKKVAVKAICRNNVNKVRSWANLFKYWVLQLLFRSL